MVTKALQGGASTFFESSVVKPSKLSSNGKQSVPISAFSCKNNISSAKPYVLTSNATGFQTGKKKENSKMSLLPICVDGLTCAEEMKICPPITSEKLVEWIRDSVIEILKHIQGAPFQHHVPDGKSPSASLKKQRDYADVFGKVDSWAKIGTSVRNISPDAVILVQKLNQDISPESEEENVPDNGNRRHSTDQQGRRAVWGLLIQGRGVGLWSECLLYFEDNADCFSLWILNQFRFDNGKCFGPTPRTQLTNSWLL
eukprot:PITA_08448